MTITASNLKIDHVYKPETVYKVSYGEERAVLKRESIKMVGTSTTKTRTDWITNNNGAKPQVKKSIDIAAKIISWVTKGDTKLDDIKTFTEAETKLIVFKVAAKDNLQVFGGIQKTLVENNVWYLMPILHDFSGIGFTYAPEWPNIPQRVKSDIKSNPKCMRSLGHVLVCDAFLANTDRIGKLAKSSINQKGAEAANPGNLFISWSKQFNDPYFLGIDFIDTQFHNAFYMGGKWSLGTKLNLTSVEQSVLHNFNLLKESNKKLREPAARYAVEAVAEAIAEIEKIPVRFSEKHVKELIKGFDEGIDRLKRFYKSEVYSDEWPEGLKSRFEACGW